MVGEIISGVVKSATEIAFTALFGYIVAQIPFIKDWLHKNRNIQTIFFSTLSLMIILSAAMYVYNYILIRSLYVDQGKERTYGERVYAFPTPNHVGPVNSVCPVNSYMVGLEYWGNIKGDCSGCFASGRVICRPLIIKQGKE